MNQNDRSAKNRARRPAPQPKAAANTKQKPQTQARPQQNVKPQQAHAQPRQRTAARPAKGTTARRTTPTAPNRAQRPIDRTIKAQTPAQRQAQRSGKRITGSAKNMEVNHSTKTSRKKFRVKKKTPLMRLLLSRLVLFLISYAIIFGVFSWLFYLNLTDMTGIAGSDYKIVIGEDEAESSIEYTSPANTVGANGTYNVSIDAMRDLCEFTVTGDSDILRYIPRGNPAQSVSFVVGTDVAYVNGVMIHLEAKSFMSKGELHVPISFFKNYVAELQLHHNPSDALITVMRTETSESAADTKKDPDEAIFEPIRFLLCENQPLTNITEESVDES